MIAIAGQGPTTGFESTGGLGIRVMMVFSFFSFLALDGDGERAYITGYYHMASGWKRGYSAWGIVFYFLFGFRFWIGYGLDSEWPARGESHDES